MKSYVVTRPCVVCGLVYTTTNKHSARSTHCSKECSRVTVSQKTAERRRRLYLRTCVGCGVSFMKRPNRNKGLYCSRACAWSDPNWRMQLREERRAKRIVRQDERRAESIRRRSKALAESQARRAAAYANLLQTMKAERAKVRAAREPKPCPECGQAFVPFHGRRQYCSDACLKRRMGRIEKRVRRARKVGAQIRERVDPVSVFKRDGWRCQLCGRKVGRRHDNTPKSPELDHITPLALGGTHTYDNVQCACRACNGSKGATVKGQLRLCG
jgi:hypothetical protein